MASHLRDCFESQSPENGSVLDNMGFILTQVSSVRSGADISHTPSAQLKISPNDSDSCAKHLLQTPWEMFTSWLQPEKQGKEQMISQLDLEQFLKIGRYKSKFAVKGKRE